MADDVGGKAARPFEHRRRRRVDELYRRAVRRGEGAVALTVMDHSDGEPHHVMLQWPAAFTYFPKSRSSEQTD